MTTHARVVVGQRAEERPGPQPGPQTDAIAATWCEELFYGGAAFGGKTEYLLLDFLQDVDRYAKAWRGILFRKSYTDLEEIIERSRDMFVPTGAEYQAAPHWRWTWPNGATLRFRYMESPKDMMRWQGQAFTWIGWDELTQWATDRAYRYLRARLRVNASLGIDVPTKRIRATANPGGPGHHWVKARWVTPNPSGYAVRECDETGHKLLFIPAKIRDNPIGLSADPEYANRLKGLGSPELVRAWLDGDWNIVEGAYFDCWSAGMVLRPVTLPADWLRFRSCDWGSASPFAVHWWAVVQDDWRHLDGPILPRGALVCYREWYGSMNPADEGQRGLKLTAEELAEGIVRRERGDKLAYGVIDPAAFTEDGGPSKAERINNVLTSARMVGFHAADNRRVASVGKHDAPRGPVGGWDQLRARMKGTDGQPMIYTFDTCVAAIRTIPALQHDPNRPEDLDTSAEDHCGDSWRYAAMSRPWMPTRKVTLTVHDGYRAANESNNERWMHI